VLNQSGYRTGFIGKWHLGGEGKPEWSPEIDGGFIHKKYMFNRGHWKKFELTETGAEVASQDKKGEPSYNLDNADEKSFSTDFLTDRCIDFVGRKESEPFLAVVSYPDPHGPNTVRAPYNTMFDHLRFLPPRTYGLEDVIGPKWLGDEKGHTTFKADQMRQYFGMVKCLDDNIGRLLHALEANGKLDSTIVMMTSDHGDLCYEHDRLNKGNPYEGSARVPMLIRLPKKIPAGSVYSQPFGTVDITPTLLHLAGHEYSADTFQGRDLSVALRDKAPVATSKYTFLRNAGTKASWICVVDPRYKLILSANDRPWLFDNQQDPDELHNFFGRPGTETVTRMLAESLKGYSVASDDAFAKQPTIAKSLNLCLQVGL
jgi:arylsulfatase A-like enzyme